MATINSTYLESSGTDLYAGTHTWYTNQRRCKARQTTRVNFRFRGTHSFICKLKRLSKTKSLRFAYQPWLRCSLERLKHASPPYALPLAFPFNSSIFPCRREANLCLEPIPWPPISCNATTRFWHICVFVGRPCILGFQTQRAKIISASLTRPFCTSTRQPKQYQQQRYLHIPPSDHSVI